MKSKDIKATALYCDLCDKHWIVKSRAMVSKTFKQFVKTKGVVCVCPHCGQSTHISILEYFDGDYKELL